MYNETHNIEVVCNTRCVLFVWLFGLFCLFGFLFLDVLFFGTLGCFLVVFVFAMI